MTTRVPIRYGGTGANTAAGARDALGVLANTGGTISGDLTITGNLVVSGNSTTLNTETLIVEDNEIVLNSNVAGPPTLNSGLIVNRGSSPNTFLRWNEGTDKWGWSDDGTTFYSFDSGLNAYGQANAAYGQANAAYGQANLAYGQANAAYSQANLAYDAANNAKVTVYANNASNITTQKINFVNTATVTVSVTADGSNANIAFTSLGGGGSLSNIRVSQNSSGTINANGFNFVNTSSVTIAVNQGTDGNANISFTANKTNTVIRSETFTAANTDANLTYNILYYPSSVEYVFVNKNGISLVPVTDFTLAGNTVTLIDSGESGDNIEIRYFVDVSTVPATNTTIVVESNTVASQTSTFTLSQNVATINRLTITKNGLQLTPNTHYTLANGKEVTLTTVAEVNDELVFRYFLDLGNIQDIALLAYNQANLAYTAANNRVLKAGDTMTGNLNVAASLITQNVEPNLNVTYNLGTTTKRFKDLWLSNSTIYLGDAQITANGSKLVVDDLQLSSGANLSNAVLKTGDTMTGNLTFSGTGLRILGDFSNATTNNRLLFQTTAANETTRITAIPSGTGPGAQFRAHNTVDSVNFGAVVMYMDSTSGYLNVGAAGSSPFLPLQFQLGGSERMRLDTSGNLGIGTSSPSTYGILAIRKNSTSAPPYIVLDNRGLDTTDANTYTQGGLLFGAYRDISNPAYIASITVARTSASGGASSGGDIVFGANSVPTTGVPTERMRITSGGNVGIGTSSPSSRLTVNGVLTLASGNSNAPAIANTSDTDTGVYFPANNEVAIATGGTVAAAFNSNGLFFRNRVINGDMRIDQRNAGAAVTASGTYPVDRFFNQYGAGTLTFQQSSSIIPTGFTQSLGVTVTSAGTRNAGDYYAIITNFEGNNISDWGLGSAGALTTTLSFWVRSSVTGLYSGVLNSGDNNRSYAFNYTISSANTWEKKTIAIAGDTSGGTTAYPVGTGVGLRLRFDLGSGSNYQITADSWQAQANKLGTSGTVNWAQTAGATLYITGVQLETGSVATPFERRPFGTELMLCQRYYEKLKLPYILYVPNSTYLGFALGTYQFIVEKRAAPTMSAVTGASLTSHLDRFGIGFITPSSPVSDIISANSCRLYYTLPTSYTVGESFTTISDYWQASAEL